MRNLLLIIVSVISSISSFAQWSTDAATNTAICSTSPQAARTQITTVPDGANGMFIAWVDARTTGESAIYIQRVDHQSKNYFTENGLLIATSPNSKGNLAMVPDGSGGVIITWTDNNDVFGRRIAANGSFQWDLKNMTVTTAGTQSQGSLAIINSTEAMIAFLDSRNSTATGNDVYIQKINLTNGNTIFTNDLPATNASGNQSVPKLIADGSGGALIMWQDTRNSATTGNDYYCQRLKNDGTPETGWASNGNVICVAAGTQGNFSMKSDGVGGFYAIWEDFRNTAVSNGDIYAHRFGGDGNPVWTSNGVVVNESAGIQNLPKMLVVNDGIIAVWTDGRITSPATDRDIYAQKLAASNGAAQWSPTTGVSVAVVTGSNQTSITSDGLSICSDGSNGAIIGWVDARNTSTTGNDIYAQKINSTGAVQWAANGILISNASGNQGNIISSEYCAPLQGAFFVWQDARSGTSNFEIYGALVNSSGNLTSAVSNRQALVGKIKAFPVPASKQIYLSLSKVKPGAYLVQVIDISGRVLLQNKTAVNGTEALIETRIEHLQSGVYFIKLTHESSKAESVYKFTKQ
jgi:Secretion system C-terminal sorting domain